MKIAILGWGSLVWDPGSLSQLCGHFFKQGGPTLRIEFSRVSEDGRLTLVIDRENGADVPTRVATSTSSTLDDAVTDVWIRETRFFGERSGAEKRSKDGTIGYADLAGENASIKIHPDHQYAYDLITPWLKTSGFDAVVWTALRSNFKDFSVEEAVNYLKSLPRTFHSEKASQQDAFEYIVRAPEEVETPLRKRLRDLGLIPRMPSPNDIIGARNVKEALGFLKDWVTALITITTAAIGVFAAFLPNLRHYHHWQRWLLGLTLLCLGLTVFFGCNVLYMLPGCAQRRPFPNEDIYSLRNLHQTLGSWVRRFWWAFLASVLSILTFYASTMGFDFFQLAILADLIVLATIVFPKIRDWFNTRHKQKNAGRPYPSS
jgi:hypothetical protein